MAHQAACRCQQGTCSFGPVSATARSAVKKREQDPEHGMQRRARADTAAGETMHSCPAKRLPWACTGPARACMLSAPAGPPRHRWHQCPWSRAGCPPAHRACSPRQSDAKVYLPITGSLQILSTRAQRRRRAPRAYALHAERAPCTALLAAPSAHARGSDYPNHNTNPNS